MRGKSILSLLVLTVLLIITGLAGPGCATIVPPQGGAKDSLPPVLVRVNPADKTTGFSTNRVIFTFDEYIELDNYTQNVIVSPVPSSFPTVTRKLNTINVKLRDTLEENTTYSINFGRSIKDLNEGNIYQDFTYVFSTGRYIDSFQFRGNIVIAETGGVDTTLTVLLHRSSDDSVVFKERPRYVTKTDGTGAFVFKNLPPDTFYIYALKDAGGSYRYQNKEALFAFASAPVVVGDSTPRLTLYAYDLPAPPTKPAPAGGGKKKTADRIKYTTVMKEKQGLTDSFMFVFEVPLASFDSSKIHLTVDSSYTPVTGYSFSQDTLAKNLTIKYPWKPNSYYNLILEKDFATDTLGQQLLIPDTISFYSRSLEEYSKLNLRFRNLDLSVNPVLQLLVNNEVAYAFPLTGVTLNQDLILPGDYSLRLLEDRNRNGIWDPGVFPGARIQPELVRPLERKLQIKANTNFPIELDLNAREVQKKPGVQPTGPAGGNNRLRR